MSAAKKRRAAAAAKPTIETVRPYPCHIQDQLVVIKTQVHLLAAAARALEACDGYIEIAHVTSGLEALIEPIAKVLEDIDRVETGAKGVQS